MFPDPRPPFPIKPMGFDEVFAWPRDHGYHSNPPVTSSTAENDQLYVQQCSTPVCNPSLSGPSSDAAFASTRVTYIQMPHDPEFWSLSHMLSPTMMEERRGTQLAWNNTRLDGHVSSSSLSPHSFNPNKQPLLHPVSEETSGIDARFLSKPDRVSSLARPLREVTLPFPAYSNAHNVSEPSIPHHIPLHQSLNPPPPHQGTHPDSHSYPRIHHPSRHSRGSARHRRPVRAVEHDSRWIDEAELLQGLTEPSGNISIHRCSWEEDLSPCHLSIRGNKSCINVHIQKWHGGKPGGDKFRAICRWSGCGAVMLKDSIPRHILSIHLGEVWECQGCGKEISRNDAYGRHAARSDFEACRTSGAVITYFDATVINARAALNGGGNLRYAGV